MVELNAAMPPAMAFSDSPSDHVITSSRGLMTSSTVRTQADVPSVSGSRPTTKLATKILAMVSPLKHPSRLVSLPRMPVVAI